MLDSGEDEGGLALFESGIPPLISDGTYCRSHVGRWDAPWLRVMRLQRDLVELCNRIDAG